MANIQKSLLDFFAKHRISVQTAGKTQGARVVRYEFKLIDTQRLRDVYGLAEDMTVLLGVDKIKIVAPIVGKPGVFGIEMQCKTGKPVVFQDLINSENFQTHKSAVSFVLGETIDGHPLIADLNEMPHLLIGGTTKSGKSVCVHNLITSIMIKACRYEAQFVLIDPKKVEFTRYKGSPFVMGNIITCPKIAENTLKYLVNVMERRYFVLESFGVENAEEMNKLTHEERTIKNEKGENVTCEHMFNIIIVIDELADLMMTGSKNIENYIVRIAQMGRAANINLILATQSPRREVVTGLIKGNMPSRIAFTTANSMESQIILDESGAEKLYSRGDALFKPMGQEIPTRFQGAFIPRKESLKILENIKKKYA